ncbi:GGDEF domain-containing protein [Nocardioides panacisoli]|uniref:GGDEF domain-containing protein n=1 Tax=Nocardioides panacisoli TaxID=627624 RepID=A0ABP7J8P2_9ACTN
MDTVSLRVAFAVVAVAVLVLFYFATYRRSRSTFTGWWIGSLALFVVSAGLYLFNGTPAQAVANPTANALAVGGAAGVWAAAQSLRGHDVRRGYLLPAPLVVLVVSLLDDPAHDKWAGGPFFLLGVASMMGLASRETWLAWRDLGRSDEHATEALALALVSGLMAVFYLGRAIAFVAVGPDHAVFEALFGSEVTTLLLLVLLVVVTFSMSNLAHAQRTAELSRQAASDELTGLLNRRGFLSQAEAVLARTDSPAGAAILIADFDGFKEINDSFGHLAGDRALAAFGEACRSAVRTGDIVGRMGGDEFAILLTEGSRAEEVAERISERFASTRVDAPLPTLSFGIAEADATTGLVETFGRADAALYRAKAAGRNRTARHGDGETTSI